jgi:DeoR/GlpR family transcriptional regulator of sugar metabolism
MPDRADLSVRQKAIVQDLKEHGFVSTTDLAAKHGVSDMTIRRDARILANAGVARSVHGGLMLPHGTMHGADFAARANDDSDAKGRIAAACMTLVSDTDRIFIDAGTTAYGVARALPSTFTGTIITHSAPVMQQALHLRAARTIALGGELLHDSQAFIGDMAIAQLERLRAETAFIGLAGLDDRAFYIERSLERATKKAIMAASDRVALVAAASKLGRSDLVRLGTLEEADVLVTDREPSAGIRAALRAADVELVVADGS